MKSVLWTVLLLAAATVSACDRSPSDEGSGLVGRVELDGAPPTGRLFRNHEFVLTASTYAPDNSIVTNVPITWSTSDSTIVSIELLNDTHVLVRAGRDGNATLTVTSDGRRASIALQVLAVPVATVHIDPAPVALYPNGAAQLTVVARDSFGGDASSRPVSWSTSNAQRVQVGDDGLVQALSVGQATITATVEGKSATASVVVLPRPVSDWSQVSDDWVTHQGTALHTGFVPATVDPTVFRLKWEKALFTGGVNPVAAAEGLVFASGAIPDMHVVRALDAATGTQRWEHHVGNNSSVDPPGYGDGNVYVQTGGHEDSFLHGMHAATGTPLFSAPYGNQWSRYHAPVVSGGRVFMAGGMFGGMYAFDGAAGTQLWFRQLNQYDQFTPLVQNGVVYAYTGLYEPKLTAASATDGSLLYEIPDPNFRWMGWSMGSSLIMTSPSSLVGAQSNRLLSFDLAARSIRWVVTGADDFRQPAYADGIIYISRRHDVEARRASDGGLIWTWHVPGNGAVTAPIVVTRNVLFVSTADRTYGVDLAAVAHAWSYPAGGFLTISRDGTLYIARANGTLTAVSLR